MPIVPAVREAGQEDHLIPEFGIHLFSKVQLRVLKKDVGGSQLQHKSG
jgi:hypothetical protein